jgi:RND superfamily putative drug exporter
MKLSPESLARASSKHPWRTIGVWLVLIVSMGALSSTLLGDALNQDIAFTSSPESVKAQNLLDEKFASTSDVDSTEFVIVQSSSSTVDDPQFQAFVTKVQGDIASLPGDILASRPVTYYDVVKQSEEQAAGLVSKDRRTTLIPVPLKDAGDSSIADLRAIADRDKAQGFTVQVAGQATLGADFTKIAEEDLRKGESIGIGIALLVLIVVFAAVVAAVTPIVMALFAIAVAVGLVALIGQVFGFNLFVTNMVTMIGLAVGIDYSLFIVSRYREERKKGFEKLEAIGASGATANRAVFFSGLTVVLALLGMLIIPTTIFRSLAGGAILVTIAALAASMTLLPAILALLGDHINWPRLSARARMDSDHDPKGGFWDRVTRGVMARPVVYLVASVLVLGALGSFYFQLNRGTSQNVSQLSDDFPSKQAFLTLQREFSGGVTEPAKIVITGDVQSDAVQAAITRLRDAIARDPVFAPNTTVTPSKDGTLIEVDAFFRGDPSNDTAFQGIRDLRSTIAPQAFNGVSDAQVLVGGDTAFFTDFLDVADHYQWIVLAFVLGLSFILLTVVFRSIVLPIQAIIMNLLSVSAAYGAVTLVFQKGVGIGLFNAIGFQFQQTDAIEAWLPLFLFSVLFGLSMDYHVFLLSRIREEYDKTGNNREAVAYGLRTTAGIITGAALIMVAVFTGFAAGRLGPLQQMGFGLAVAVFMDATIVRTLLVPASMRLLGDRNWYLPRWLEWLPKVNVEGHEPPVVVLPETSAELVEQR